MLRACNTRRLSEKQVSGHLVRHSTPAHIAAHYSYNRPPASIQECSTPIASMSQAPSIFSRSLHLLRYIVAMVLLLIAALVVVSNCAREEGSKLLPFRSDGCSLAPDFEFRECCVGHDYHYWKGGTEQARLDADLEFQRCISNESPRLSHVYYAAVRVGGLPGLCTQFRWGFGWTNIRSYDALRAEDIEQVQALTNKYIKEGKTACSNGNREACEDVEVIERLVGLGDAGGSFESAECR